MKKVNIIIWGIGETFKRNMSLLKKNIKIIAFIESFPSTDFFLDKKVISPDEHINYIYDYIVVFSLYESEIKKKAEEVAIPKEKILIFSQEEFYEYSEYFRNPFHKKLEKFNQCNKKIELLCTGISYHNNGIDTDCLPVPSFNMALRAQDLFYDYEFLRYLVDNRKEKLNLKYVIIGLSYYSFEYDFSKSVNNKEIIRYYPEIKKAHNLMEDEYFGDFVKKEKERLKKLSWYEFIMDIRKPEYKITDEEGKRNATQDFNKNYPITVYENKNILNNMILYLKQHNIKIKILIMPTTKVYAKYCSKQTKEKFYKQLNEIVTNNKDIQIIDCFDSYECDNEDYYHVTHFNNEGAHRFTEYLSEIIEW